MSNRLEKPVLFDVTEHVQGLVFKFADIVGKAGFIWCHGTRLIISLIMESLKGWKSRFYLMSRNCFSCIAVAIVYILLEKPVLFDVTELPVPKYALAFFDVGKAGFIWCHGTRFTNVNRLLPCWKSRFYLMSRNKKGEFLTPLMKLEKPVLFDVTEPDWGSNKRCGSCWKSRFYLMSRNPK